MCSQESASAPEFFLHHGFIDKIWDDWQKKSLAHKYAFFPTVQENMTGTDLTPVELIDLSTQPGGVSAEYEPYKPEQKIRAELAGKKLLCSLHSLAYLSLRLLATLALVIVVFPLSKLLQNAKLRRLLSIHLGLCIRDTF